MVCLSLYCLDKQGVESAVGGCRLSFNTFSSNP